MMSKRETGSSWQENLSLVSQYNRKGFFGKTGSGYESKRRVQFLLVFLFLFAGIVVARSIYLQVFSGGQHALQSDGNHVEQQIVLAPRGEILDVDGRSMTNNQSVEPTARDYVLGRSAAQLTGYLAKATEEELGCHEGICYYSGDYIGRTGVEKMFETTLKGRDGGKIVEVDSKGQPTREMGSNEPEPGSNVNLSIDARLQDIAYQAMKERSGSVVAIDLSGKVKALVSSPSYDPNLFTTKPDSAKLQSMLNDNDKQYFLNRAISGQYAPGSIYKLVTAYAGLESGAINQDTQIEDTGEIKIDQYRFGNWYFDQYGRKEGKINIVKALARSNDIFFYKVGEMVGVDTLVKWSRKFGLGETTGIELPGEQAGFVPDRLWRERLTGEKWFLGNTYHLSIGQGDLSVTPAQAARMTAAAVSGRLCKLSILKDSEAKCEDLGIKEENLMLVREGMRQVCATGGTAFPFFDFVPAVMCKTGTAEHAGQKTETDLPHAWITVAYPASNPEMILTVMLEAAGEGSYEAGPVAKEILSKWRDLGR